MTYYVALGGRFPFPGSPPAVPGGRSSDL